MAEKTYGQMLREKGISFLSRGLTKDKVVIGRDVQGAKTKAVTDELGNTVTEHNNKQDQVDVKIVAPHISISSKEVRQ